MLRAPLFVAVLVVCGCASQSSAARAERAFHFAPASPGNGLLVLYRNLAGFMGQGAVTNCSMTIDGKAVGDLAQDNYAVIEVGPGEHTVNLFGKAGMSNVLVQVAAGEVRFVQVETTPSLRAKERSPEAAQRDLDNEGEPLTPGVSYKMPATGSI